MILEKKNIFDTKNIELIIKRKSCTSKIKIIPGVGNIYINQISDIFSFCNYLKNTIHIIFKVLNLTSIAFDIFIRMYGGGIQSRVHTVFYGILRLFSKQNKHIYLKLLNLHLLNVDTRVIERKKFGLKKARKSSQYHKR